MIHAHLRLSIALGGAALVALLGVEGCGTTHAGFSGDSGADMNMDASTSDVGSFLPPDGGGGGFGDATFSMGDGGSPVMGLYFNPPMATVTVTSATMPTPVPFTLMAKQKGGGPDVAVTPQTAVFTRSDLATLAIGNPVNVTPTGHTSGSGVLQGIYQGAGATATLQVQVHLSNVGAGVDPTAPGALDGATAQDPSAITLLYPYDKTVFPLGLKSPLVMWNAPKAGDVYRLHYEEKDFVCDDYEVVTPPAQLRIDGSNATKQGCWDWLTSSNQGDPIQVTLSRWDAATKMAYVSAKETWTLAKANMQGAVYYWTTSGPSDAYLAKLGTGAGATPLPLTVNGQQVCMACHAVSADGTTLVAVAGDIGMPSSAFPGENTSGTPGYCATSGACQEDMPTDDRAWISFGLPTTPTSAALTTRKQSNLFGGNLAVNPDGKYAVFGDVQLYLADTTVGTPIPNTGLDNFMPDIGTVGLMMPAFSPDGAHLTAVEGPADPSGQPSFITLAGSTGKLVELDFNEMTHTFSNPKRLAAESGFPVAQSAIAYPTFSPDANWIAFHVGDKPTACENNCDAAETSTGAIYLQNTSGAAPVRLAALTDTPTVPAAQQNHTFEPTFNPVERGGYFWVVVSNERDWGNRIKAGTAPANGNKRLWVGAIDKTPGTGDPSHPPFFLEGQDENRLNMRGFWALAACIPTGQGTCTVGFECCSGYCDPNGICVDIGNTMPTCVPLGGACGVDAGIEDAGVSGGCCNSPPVACINSVCALPMSQ
jgi:hypothetical protein